MTLHEILLTINLKLRTSQLRQMTPEEFNSFVKFINRKLFSKGVETLDAGQSNVDYMSEFIDTADLTLASGLATKPLDYARKATIVANGRTVEVLTPDNFDIRKVKLLGTPDASFPICKFVGTKIEFFPTSLTAVKLQYYKLPTDPVFGS